MPIYLANLFFSLHFAATLFINSTYLGSYFSQTTVSLLYIIGSLGSITLFMCSGELLKRFGPKQLLVLLIVFEYVAVSGLIIAPSLIVLALAFFLYACVSLLVYYCLDILLEDLTENSQTGEIRGTYLTVMNLAVAAAPIIVSSLAQGEDLVPVYLASLVLLWPVMILAILGIKGKRHKKERQSLTLPFKAWWRAINVRRVTISRFVLEAFFGTMIIFTPIYLHSTIGFNWAEIGVMFTIMLLPFLLFELPVGIAADKLFGEKEIMTLGFFISGVSLLFMPFIGHSFVLWTLALFASRVGASFIEVTTESYFFKHVDARDTGLISIFRLSRPAAMILAAAVGSLSLALFSFEKIYFVLAVVIFLGMKQSLHLKDTL